MDKTQPNVISESEKRRRVVRNIVSQFIYNGVVIIFGLILPRLYLVSFGSDVNGLVSTVKDIFAYLALLEAGIGLNAQYALYKPIANGEKDNINSILAATRHYYIRTGTIYAAITLLLAVVYPLVMQTSLDYFTVFIIIIFYGAPGVITFFAQGKYRPLLEVDGKNYIYGYIYTATFVIGKVLTLVLLLISDDLLLIQFSYTVPTFFQVGLMYWYVHKNYPWVNWKDKPNLKALSQKGSVLIHQLSQVIFKNTDTVILSIIWGMKYASVYVIYMLFFSNFDKIVQIFVGAINFRLGQLFHTAEERFFKVYELYETTLYMMSFLCHTVLAAFILPFITLYTKGVNDVEYIKPLYVILFTAANLLTTLKHPNLQVVNIAGKFDATRTHAIVEMVINITVSVVATIYLGIIGVLIGTIAALLYRVNITVFFCRKKIFGYGLFREYKKIIVNSALTAVILWFIGTQGCEATSYLYVIGNAALNMLWIGALFIVVNFIIEWKTLKVLPAIAVRFVKKKLHKA